MPLEISTAENVSNLTWVIFAAASLLWWRVSVRPKLGRRFRRSLWALLGVLLLMFPIISISDDLHPDMIAAVEGESKSRVLKPADTPRPAPHATSQAMPFAVTAAVPFAGPTVEIRSGFQPLAIPVSSRVEVFAPRFRAPPDTQLS